LLATKRAEPAAGELLRCVAGVEGFEPPNGGIKTRCLTTWRHPSINYRGPTDRHLTSSNIIPAPRLRQHLMHRRNIQPTGNIARPAIRHPRRQARRINPRGTRREDTGTRSSQPRRRELTQPIERVGDLRKPNPHHRLAIIPNPRPQTGARLKKVAYCDEG